MRKKLGKLINRMNEVNVEGLKGYSESYIQGYMECKAWIKQELRKILEEE
jgi:hypothetical protein